MAEDGNNGGRLCSLAELGATAPRAESSDEEVHPTLQRVKTRTRVRIKSTAVQSLEEKVAGSYCAVAHADITGELHTQSGL